MTDTHLTASTRFIEVDGDRFACHLGDPLLADGLGSPDHESNT